MVNSEVRLNFSIDLISQNSTLNLPENIEVLKPVGEDPFEPFLPSDNLFQPVTINESEEEIQPIQAGQHDEPLDCHFILNISLCSAALNDSCLVQSFNISGSDSLTILPRV